MDASYDECLEQNPFFQLIQESHSDIIAKAIEELWIICIPRAGTMEPTSINVEDILEHILVPDSSLTDTHFYTLTKQEVAIREKYIITKYDERIRILFDETCYIDKSRKYKLWCIDRPLSQKCEVSPCEDYSCIRNVHDCVRLLWTKDGNVLEEVNKVIDKFLSFDFEFESIDTLKDKTSVLYQNCMEIITKEPCFSDNVTLAIETYVHHCIHNKLFRAVCNYTSQADANLNKILRNFSDTHLNDLDIKSEFLENFSSIKHELSNLNKVSTTLGKIECLRCVVKILSYKQQSFVTTDDLLKIFVLLIVKSNLGNWLGNLAYITHFRFSSLHRNDENSFLITTLEAAIEYIKTDNIRTPSDLDKDCSSIDTLNNFFKCVKAGNLNAIKKVFGSKSKHALITDKVTLCHPLCCCEKCKSYTPFSINSQNDKNCTALHIACFHGQPHIVEYLLSRNVEINVLDDLDSTPLHYAALNGNQNALLLLLHANAEVEPRNCDGNTPLHLAANNGHENCVKALLYFIEQKGGSIDVNAGNNMGDTPLHFACKWGYTSIVNILLQYGAKVVVTNKRNQTVLDVVHNDYLKKLLIADNAQSSTFEYVKSDSTLLRVKSKSVEHSKRIDLVTKCIEDNDLPLMCFYLGIPSSQSSANVDTRLTCHPLCTCENCQKQFENSNSSPPSFQEFESMNINKCNSYGYSPLHVAAKNSRTDMLRLLLDAGALVNVRTSKHHYTPLHLACKNQQIQVVRELLQCGGCDTDAQDAKGNTSLHYACLSNDSKIVELLLSNGSDFNIKNREGRTSLQEAKGRMLCNIVKLLNGKCGGNNLSENVGDLFSL